MKKILVMASREIRQKVRQRGYIITTIALPLIIIVVGLVTEGLGPGDFEPIEPPSSGTQEQTAVGYIDRADLIQQTPDDIPASSLEEFASIDSAQTALRNGTIDAYYIIGQDYRETGEVERVSLSLDANPPDTQLFEWFLIHNLSPDLGADEIAQLRWPFNADGLETIRIGAGDDRETNAGSMVPYFVGILVMMPLFTGGGYLFQSLTQEKSSRMLEILLVSIKPRQMLVGKVLGYGVLVLLQYAVWAVLAGVAALVTGGEALRLLDNVRLAGPELLWLIPFALGGFILYAGIMAGFGAMVEDLESSRIWIFIISLPMLIPFYLGTAITQAPNGNLAVALSMIPFSAPVAMALRLSSASVPVGQLAVSAALILLTGWGMVALMARLFKAQTLLSGEEFSMRKFMRTLA
jgi:ABC-2 type transport system permease protein